MILKRIIISLIALCSFSFSHSQSSVWIADKGDGTYRNPVLHADYSDPDVVRVKEDYYMIASSFNHVPGIPILHSKDLVNWRLIGHALKELTPIEHFSKTQHGNGVWAPAIRYHQEEFYIYYPDPDFGIYLIKAKNILGPWTSPELVVGGKGLIDPCPLWDDDGRVYLVHAFAGSRAGIKSVLILKELNAGGTRAINNGVMIYDGHETDPTIEGPKIHKRKGYYYVFAPAGGVSTGWQTVLRSKNIYGPYERKVVMDQGKTPINGPHQGAWVDTESGEDWFLHFQDKAAYGRIVHLQPMKWVNDWPVIGTDPDGDGKGEPLMEFVNPKAGNNNTIYAVGESDEFNSMTLGLQWQWQANQTFISAYPMMGKEGNGHLTMFSSLLPDSLVNYWNLPQLLMQKFPAEEFTTTTRISFYPRTEGERAGLIIFGNDYAFISLYSKKEGNYISYSDCKGADKGTVPLMVDGEKITGNEVYFRVKVSREAICEFSYSIDGRVFKSIGERFVAKPGRWVGAKVGLFCTRTRKTNDAGQANVDWFRFSK